MTTTSDSIGERGLTPRKEVSKAYCPQAGRIDVLAREQLAAHEVWARCFAGRRKDHRFYELVEETIDQGFDYGYLAVRDGAGQVIAIQPYFLVDQDILAGLPKGLTRWVERVRQVWPGFMRLVTLMVGCAVGEGHLAGDDPAQYTAVAEVLSRSLVETARGLGASLLVLKEFPARYRPALARLRAAGFARMPSFPNVTLGIEYASFDELCRRHLSRNMRTKLRRKFREAAQAPATEMQMVADIAPFVDEVYPLYVQVYEKSTLKFEMLTKDFLRALGARMPDKVRFFIWRQQGKAVGFNICMIEGDALYSEYMGLDYSVALDIHLYFIIMRDVIEWAIRQGFRSYCSTGLNYEPKYHFRFDLAPLDLYVRASSGLLNFVLKPFLPLLEPTRHDPVLKRFGNYHEMWGEDTPGGPSKG